jgi:hypothetical protein
MVIEIINMLTSVPSIFNGKEPEKCDFQILIGRRKDEYNIQKAKIINCWNSYEYKCLSILF